MCEGEQHDASATLREMGFSGKHHDGDIWFFWVAGEELFHPFLESQVLTGKWCWDEFPLE